MSFSRRWWLLVALPLLPVAPLNALELTEATTSDLQSAFASGTLTAEKLTGLYLARIAAYDQSGPALNALIALNPDALATARTLDTERRTKGPRSPLHGIPFVLKDNYNTRDLPTTAGSQLLSGWIPPEDAFLVRRLREAGAILIAKANLSEFAAGGSIGLPDIPSPPNGFSSAGGQTLNPHDLTRSPGSSSGGPAAALAAGFAQFGIGSDTGGSIRGPSAATGIAGLKPSRGLLSRTGIVPLALTLDTGGPMARQVYDLAVALSVMAAPDPTDPATTFDRPGNLELDYTGFLHIGALRGVRIGVVREFTGKDSETDRLFAESLVTLEKLGAILVDPIRYPDYLLLGREEIFLTILHAEFPAQIAVYLRDLPSAYPKTLAELAARAADPQSCYRSPEKAAGLRATALLTLDLTDPRYLAVRDQGLPLLQAGLQAVFTAQQLDVVVYPTDPRPAGPILRPLGPSRFARVESPSRIANLTGWPELTVPAGMTKEGLPVGISFLAPRWTEGRLLGYGYDFEQARRGRILPASTPVLPGAQIP